MKRRFVDIHHHILYGMDDGAKDKRQMYAMLKIAASDGIGTIIATPHVTPGVKRFNREQYERSLREANDFCRTEGLKLKLLGGAEILYTDQTAAFLRDGRIPAMAGTDRVLVEFSPDVSYERLLSALERLNCEGYVPVIAHVERYRCLTGKASRAEHIKDEMNVLFQMNCGAILNPHGFREKRFIKRMLKLQMVDALGTDAHNMTNRDVNMYGAWEYICEAYGRKYADQLTDGGILED